MVRKGAAGTLDLGGRGALGCSVLDLHPGLPSMGFRLSGDGWVLPLSGGRQAGQQHTQRTHKKVRMRTPHGSNFWGRLLGSLPGSAFK